MGPKGSAGTHDGMLAAPRALDQVDRFHAMWLGYHELPHAAWLTSSMRAESRALVERVVFEERRPWTDLWTFAETWVDPALAEHYGFDAVASDGASWVASPPDRAGLLGTGSFLSVGAAVGDTSPVRRGKLIRERLFCSPVQPPPPGVDADNPPPAELAECKVDRYAQHREDPACAGCHELMDPIGFGLEGFDRQGVARTHDDGAPECAITGQGEVVPYGTFTGPAELARVALQAELDACAVDHLLQFALGRELTTSDTGLFDRMRLRFRAPSTEGGVPHRLDDLLVELVSDPAFRLRQEASP